jgi:DNA replication protein DnaC
MRLGTCRSSGSGANLFFQLISRRYERGLMILTSNQSFAAKKL